MLMLAINQKFVDSSSVKQISWPPQHYMRHQRPVDKLFETSSDELKAKLLFATNVQTCSKFRDEQKQSQLTETLANVFIRTTLLVHNAHQLNQNEFSQSRIRWSAQIFLKSLSPMLEVGFI